MLSAVLDAILFVAAAAIILADVAERCLERIQVFYACFGGLGITTQFGEPCFDILFQISGLAVYESSAVAWSIRFS
jgi:hypothetical protein